MGANQTKPLQADRDTIIRMYQVGVEVERIAQVCDRSPSSVWLALRRWGVTLRGRTDIVRAARRLGDTAWLADQWVREGRSLRAIARDTGTHPSSVRERLILAGLFDAPRSADYPGVAQVGEPPGPRERAELQRLYVEEGSIAGVARRLGQHPRRVRTQLLRAGVKLGPRGRRRRR